MTDNTSDQFNLAYTGRLGWGTLQARAYYQHTAARDGLRRRQAVLVRPRAAAERLRRGHGRERLTLLADLRLDDGGRADGRLRCRHADEDRRQEHRDVTVSAAIPLAEQSLLRVGGEYQENRLDDWWPPSGAGMWPYDFLNLNDGQRDRYAAYGEWEIQQGALDAHPRRALRNRGHGCRPGARLQPRHLSRPAAVGGMGNQTRDAALFNAESRGKTDDNWDLSWLARFTPAATQTYEIGLAQKTRSPNLYERYTWSTWQMAAFMNNFVGDGNGYFGDVDLKPEVARTVSVTADWHDAGAERWSVKVTPYYTYVQDYIDAVQWDAATNAPRAVPVVGNFTVLKYVNQSAQLYGVDLAADYRLASTTDYGKFSAQLVASYTRGKNEDTDDNLYNIMPLNAKLALHAGTWLVAQYPGGRVRGGEGRRLRGTQRNADRGLRPCAPAQPLRASHLERGARHRKPVRPLLRAAAGRRLRRPGHDDDHPARAQPAAMGHAGARRRPIDLCGCQHEVLTRPPDRPPAPDRLSQSTSVSSRAAAGEGAGPQSLKVNRAPNVRGGSMKTSAYGPNWPVVAAASTASFSMFFTQSPRLQRSSGA